MGNCADPVVKEVPTHYAICILKPHGDSGVSGIVKFVQMEGGKVIINANVKGLKSGKHGFHVHEFGNLLEGCKTAGAHYNPLKREHGGPEDKERHIGDMGNIIADGINDAVYICEDAVINLFGEHKIIGRSVVVHEDEDDLGRGGHLDSKTTGHAGNRVACGVIGLSGPFEFLNPKV